MKNSTRAPELLGACKHVARDIPGFLQNPGMLLPYLPCAIGVAAALLLVMCAAHPANAQDHALDTPATWQVAAGAEDDSLGVVARITFADATELRQLSGRLDIWEVDHAQRTLLAQLSAAQYRSLRTAGYQVAVDWSRTAKLAQLEHGAVRTGSGIPGYTCYRTVEETYSDLAQLAADHPTLARWIDIGDSWQKTQASGGYDLHALVITNQDKPGPKPVFFLMGAIHAREYTTAETATRFAEQLIAGYGTDPDITWILDYTEIHIVPQANPDGRKRAEAGASWRKNTNNTDGCFASTVHRRGSQSQRQLQMERLWRRLLQRRPVRSDLSRPCPGIRTGGRCAGSLYARHLPGPAWPG